MIPIIGQKGKPFLLPIALMALSGKNIVPNDKILGCAEEMETENRLISFSSLVRQGLTLEHRQISRQRSILCTWVLHEEQKGRGVFPLPVQNVVI